MPKPKKNKPAVQAVQTLRNWQGLVGFEQVRAKIRRLILARTLPAVILFVGRRGMGKKHFVSGVAAQIFCEKQTACGTCSSCKRFLAGEEKNYLMIEPADGRIKVDQASEIQEHLKIKTSQKSDHPFARRLVTIGDIDLATPQAVNRLLKTLEEPAEDALILLTCSKKNHLLPTLLSRTVVWNLAPPMIDKSLAYLKSHLASSLEKPVEDESLRRVLVQNGLAIGPVIHYFVERSRAKLETEDHEIGLFNTKASLSELTSQAETLIRSNGWSLERFLQECEYQINTDYRMFFESLPSQDMQKEQPKASYLRARRELLSNLRKLGVKQKISLNTQLAAERLGFLSKL